jgi:uncharacterized membrane protein
VVIAAGLVLVLLAPPPGAPVSLQDLLAVNFGRPTLNPSSFLGGVVEGNAVSILQLGTLILLGTPVARVAASVLLFLRERDLLYVGVTSLVLAMLLLAIFVVGPIET